MAKNGGGRVKIRNKEEGIGNKEQGRGKRE